MVPILFDITRALNIASLVPVASLGTTTQNWTKNKTKKHSQNVQHAVESELGCNQFKVSNISIDLSDMSQRRHNKMGHCPGPFWNVII